MRKCSNSPTFITTARARTPFCRFLRKLFLLSPSLRPNSTAMSDADVLPRSRRRSLDPTLSPIETIPPEVLCHIFLLYTQRSSHPTLDLNVGPINLLRICRLWRTVALSTPELWCRLEIDFEFIQKIRRLPFNRLGRMPHFVKQWLERSGGLPLDVVVHPVTAIVPSAPSLMRDVLDAVLGFKERLETVLIIVSTASLAADFVDKLCGAPLLQSLHVMTSSHFREPFRELDLSDMPKLTKLQVVNWAIAPSLACAPLRQLTHLWLHTPPISREYVFNLLESTCALEDLDAPMDDTEIALRAYDEPVSVPSLRKVSFRVQESQTLAPFFCETRMPNLGDLSVSVRDAARGISPPTSSDLSYFFESSKPPLHHLYLSRLFISEEELIRCLRLLPALKTLQLQFMPVSDATVRALTVARAADICPGLTTLHLDLSATRAMSSSVLIDMLLSRNTADVLSAEGLPDIPEPMRSDLDAVSLENVSISACGDLDAVAKDPRILDCISAGLKLDIDS